MISGSSQIILIVYECNITAIQPGERHVLR